MRITEVTIDGFKSYAVRTIISGWDENFNAITGLNGSGKSNILDAICFVLGITNMTTVRAQNLMDLVYKRGQAGVTKASVTITFDNTDKEKSPINYAQIDTLHVTRQIVNGTSKYLINGMRAQQTAVQTLFQSVGLNINNPNFLIMQGKVTKVLNMKPAEILAMIEEAAGTRMFEDRKDKAKKTMARKDKKVEEINELLKEEIEPKLEKLRGEKRAFIDFQKTQQDLERLSKLVVAHDYVYHKKKVEQSAADLEQKKQRVEFLEKHAERLKTEIENLAEDVQRVKEQKDKELRKGGKFQELEESVKTQSHELVRLKTVLDLKSNGIVEEQAKRKEILKNVKDSEKALKEKTKIYEKLKTTYDTAKAEYDAQTKEAERMEELLQELLTGVASKDGQESGYQAKLQEAKNLASTAATEQEQGKLKINHLTKRIKEEEPRARKAKAENAQLFKHLESLRSTAAKLQKELDHIGIEEGSEAAMKKEQSQLEDKIRDLTREANALKQQVKGLEFSYRDPYPNFDRSKVKGVLAQLFSLDEDKFNTGLALEMCAGGRLYNVVSDTADTAALLLDEKKALCSRKVTMIPLDKILFHQLPQDVIAAAEKMAPGKVNLALSLIEYEAEVAPAMKYVFSHTFICQDNNVAKQVAFDPKTRSRCVTLLGDIYEPTGTLTGGSAPSSAGILLKIQKINALDRQVAEAANRLAEINETMRREAQKLARAREIRRDLELKNHEIRLAEEQINSNSSSSIIQAVEQMKEEIASAQEAISDAKNRQQAASAEVKKIEKDMKEFKNNKGAKLGELQKNLKKLKESNTKQSEALKGFREEFQNAQVELEQVESDLSAAKEAQEEVDAAIEAQQEEVDQLATKHEEAKEVHDMALAELSDERTKLSGFDDELKALEAASRKKSAQIAEEALEKQKLGHEVSKFHSQQQGSVEALNRLEREYPWIEEEQEQFGLQGTPYDFNSIRINEAKTQLKDLTERSAGQKKKVNPKVMNMIDSVEKKEVALKTMLRTVVKDKRKIEDTIIELDRYKKEALHKTHEKVSADFGAIFNDLLQGSSAKLVAPEGKDMTEGLEVKVQLGKVWKQSLTELSGGQRSLIALSLILALLQFKPAPMYILDEVDAALDLSHTQNIGRLIKNRFGGSQFIVVSLKDGMFQNANRIFRTRFVDGTSVVAAM